MYRTLLIFSLITAVPAMSQTWRVPGDLTTIANPANATPNPPDPNKGKVITMTKSGLVTSVEDREKVTPQSTPEPSRAYTAQPPPAPVAIELPDGGGEKLATLCFEALRKSFYDPYSARMDEYKIRRMPDGGIAAVVMLNGKNRFGGYVGAKPFYCWKTAAGPFKAGEGEP